MVSAFKVFEVVEDVDLATIAFKLKDYRLMKIEDVNGREVEVGVEIRDLKLNKGCLTGVVEETMIASLNYKGEILRTPISLRTLFEFHPYRERLMLIVAAKKNRANRIASLFSSILSARKTGVLEALIPHENLKAFYEEKKSSAKVVFFDNIRIPGVRKLSLYGDQLANTALYNEYLKLGKVWYVVFEAEEGIVVGVTRNCVITFFSKIDYDDALKFIEEKILPLTVKP